MHEFVYKICKSRGKHFFVFLTKGRLIFMTSQSDVDDTLALPHLFCFLARFNFRKDLSPLRKLSLLSYSKITKNSIKKAMKM